MKSFFTCDNNKCLPAGLDNCLCQYFTYIEFNEAFYDKLTPIFNLEENELVSFLQDKLSAILQDSKNASLTSELFLCKLHKRSWNEIDFKRHSNNNGYLPHSPLTASPLGLLFHPMPKRDLHKFKLNFSIGNFSQTSVKFSAVINFV